MKLFTLVLLAAFGSFLNSSEHLTQKWVLAELEEFGDKWSPGEENKDDFVELNADGTYLMILYGEEKSGTFIHKGSALHFTNNEEKFFWKLISVSANELLVEYQQPSLIRTKLFFKPTE